MIIFKSIINPFRSIQEGIDELHEIPPAPGADGEPSIAPTSFDNIDDLTSLQWPVELCEAGSQWSTIHDACIGLSGCTDPTAYNYDPNATIVDNNACIATVNGCTDATANNYNAAATTDDGSCTYDVYGCIDATACNYDEAANTDDGSCTFAVADFDCAGNCLNGGTSTTIQNRHRPPLGTAASMIAFTQYGGTWSLTDNATGTQLASNADGDDVTLCLPDGCYDLVGVPNPPNGAVLWGYNINSTGYIFPSSSGSSTGGSHQFTVGAGVCTVLGCTDTTANNYNAAADTDDGSCMDLITGVVSSVTLQLYDSHGYGWDGSLIRVTDSGGNPAVLEANSLTGDAGIGPAGNLGEGEFTIDNVGTVAGNSRAEKTIDIAFLTAGEYIFTFIPATYSEECSWELYINGDTVRVFVSTGVGFTGNTSTNLGQVADPPWQSIRQSVILNAIATVNGCTDATANNYDAAANTDDGSCTYDVPGCMNTTANNYDAAANIDDGSCTYDVLGCTDPTAFNYDSAANIDDGSCTAAISGCTISDKWNYDPAANVDDNSTCIDNVSWNSVSPPVANPCPSSTTTTITSWREPTMYAYATCNGGSDADCETQHGPAPSESTLGEYCTPGCESNEYVTYSSSANVNNQSMCDIHTLCNVQETNNVYNVNYRSDGHISTGCDPADIQAKIEWSSNNIWYVRLKTNTAIDEYKLTLQWAKDTGHYGDVRPILYQNNACNANGQNPYFPDTEGVGGSFCGNGQTYYQNINGVLGDQMAPYTINGTGGPGCAASAEWQDIAILTLPWWRDSANGGHTSENNGGFRAFKLAVHANVNIQYPDTFGAWIWAEHVASTPDGFVTITSATPGISPALSLPT